MGGWAARGGRGAAVRAFAWEVKAVCHTDLEVDTFHVMLGGFLRDCWVGGKRSVGFGRLRAVSGLTRGFDWRAPSTGGESVSADAIGGKAGALFRAHMAERTDALRSFLDRVAA